MDEEACPFVIAQNNILSQHISDSPNQLAFPFRKKFLQFQAEGEFANFEILRKRFRNFSNFISEPYFVQHPAIDNYL